MPRFHCLACGDLPLTVGERCACGQDVLDMQVPADADLIENNRAFIQARRIRGARTVGFLLACFACFLSYSFTNKVGPAAPGIACGVFALIAAVIVPK